MSRQIQSRTHPNPGGKQRPMNDRQTRAKEITNLVTLVSDIARDDRQTRSLLALLRNGHPRAVEAPRSPDIDYSDTTGEFGITPDSAAVMQENYAAAIITAIALLEQADAIRQRMTPIGVKSDDVSDPDDWCVNCLNEAGLCEPRHKNGSRYCWWCLDVRAGYGWLPPAHIIKLRHERADKAEVARALVDYRKERKARRRK